MHKFIYIITHLFVERESVTFRRKREGDGATTSHVDGAVRTKDISSVCKVFECWKPTHAIFPNYRCVEVEGRIRGDKGRGKAKQANEARDTRNQ